MPDRVPPSTAWNDDLLRDPHAVADKRTRVRNMFAAIAPSYDLNNRLHSLWMDQRWRKKAVKLALLQPTDYVVDVACGTGDLTLALVKGIRDAASKDDVYSGLLEDLEIDGYEQHYRNSLRYNDRPHVGQLIGIDFTFEMLPIARRKQKQLKIENLKFSIENCLFLNGDALALPLPDACCDVVSIAFGIRNVQDVPAALREFYRVLRPGGRVIVLEFSLPTNPVLRRLYNFYFRQILPRTATLISGDTTGAYKYLPESVNTFIGREQMTQMMNVAGFGEVKQFPMTFGVCVCYRGVK
ncbi:MAG: class I SAM-dependent methyltransferase [Chthoniobacterales bacterium]|nr:class I SAM-dependent methyltransferase [Chthoniobacterales bacterium]